MYLYLSWKSTVVKTAASPVQDKANSENNKQLLHQKEAADNLAQAEGLLKDLFMDVSKAKKLKHPQAGEIERECVYSTLRPVGSSNLQRHIPFTYSHSCPHSSSKENLCLCLQREQPAPSLD